MPIITMLWIVQLCLSVQIIFAFRDQAKEFNKRFDELEEKLKKLK